MFCQMCSITICIQRRHLSSACHCLKNWRSIKYLSSQGQCFAQSLPLCIISCAKVNIEIYLQSSLQFYMRNTRQMRMTTCKIELNAHVFRMTIWILFMHTLQILLFLSNGIPTATFDFK